MLCIGITTGCGRWYAKTIVGWVGDGVQKLPLGVWATVQENRRGMVYDSA